MKEGFVIKLLANDRYYSTDNIMEMNNWSRNAMDAVFLNTKREAIDIIDTIHEKYPSILFDIVPVYRGIYFKPIHWK